MPAMSGWSRCSLQPHLDDIYKVLSDLDVTHNVKVKLDANGKMTHIAFCSHEQVQTFAKFPEVVCMDGTYQTNREEYGLNNCIISGTLFTCLW